MKFTFQQKLNAELLLSERRRTSLLIGIFVFVIITRYLIEQVFILQAESVRINSFLAVWLFPLTILLFEIISFLYLNEIKIKNRRVPLIFQYLNAACEIALPSFIILIVAHQYPSFIVLRSPAVMIYFLFIILSTLRLNMWLSIFCGVLSALCYAVFCIVLYNRFYSEDLARSMILLICGIAAGLVARQIREGINRSLNEAEKRHKVENLFGQQISMEVAEKILANDGNIESKRTNVAIMFIDIRNFTKFAANKTPEEIVQYQNAFFKLVINTVTKYNGIVHQFLGDGCMVSFGAPIYLENPSQNAVNASIELLQAVKDAIGQCHLESTRIGIGIHSGEAVTGNIGTEERQQYSITGNVVILAARIEQLNKQFGSQLLISQNVYTSLHCRINEIEPFGTIPLKGWHSPVSIYKLA